MLKLKNLSFYCKRKVSGYKNGTVFQTWYFKDYKGIDIIEANLNSQFARVVFLTGINSNNRFIGADLYAVQNRMAMQDTNRILLCGGMFSYSSANTLARSIGSKIRSALEKYKNQEDNERVSNNFTLSSACVADELIKLKELYDIGVLTEQEFSIQKQKLLNDNKPYSQSFSHTVSNPSSTKHPKPEKSKVSDVPVPTSTTRYKQCPNCGGNCLKSSTKCKHCGFLF